MLKLLAVIIAASLTQTSGAKGATYAEFLSDYFENAEIILDACQGAGVRANAFQSNSGTSILGRITGADQLMSDGVTRSIGDYLECMRRFRSETQNASRLLRASDDCYELIRAFERYELEILTVSLA